MAAAVHEDAVDEVPIIKVDEPVDDKVVDIKVVVVAVVVDVVRESMLLKHGSGPVLNLPRRDRATIPLQICPRGETSRQYRSHISCCATHYQSSLQQSIIILQYCRTSPVSPFGKHRVPLKFLPAARMAFGDSGIRRPLSRNLNMTWEKCLVSRWRPIFSFVALKMPPRYCRNKPWA